MADDAHNDNRTMPLTIRGAFGALDATEAAAVFERLHERVAAHRGRVQITRRGSDETCVLISKTELDSLERAVEILSNTDSAAAMRDELYRVASQVTAIAEPAAH